MLPITRYSRCKRYSGAVIKCPECHTIRPDTGHLIMVSFTDARIVKEMVDKFDWLIEKGKYSKQ